MPKWVYVGIDLGSTSLKIAAFDAVNGEVMAQAGASVPWERCSLGTCQVPGEKLRKIFFSLLAEVSAALSIRGCEVAAIACVGHGGGLYLVDEKGVLQDDFAVSSTDQRAKEISSELSASGGVKLFETVGCNAWSGQPVLIARHIFKPKSPASVPNTLFFAKDYLSMLLTGVRVTDYSDASTAGLLNRNTREPAELAFVVGQSPILHKALLPALKTSGDHFGYLLPDIACSIGLPPGIPVAVGAIDLFGAMTGVGAVKEGDMAAVFGTWCVNAAIGPASGEAVKLFGANAKGVSNIVLLDSAESTMYMNNSAASMANTTWFAGITGLGVPALLDQAFCGVPGANGLRYLPYINGGPMNGAMFVGLRASHSQIDMARAVVEGVVALHVLSLRGLEAVGIKRKRLFALGGGGADKRLTSLLATMCETTVLTPGKDESGARGAAMFAARSIGQSDIALVANVHSVFPEVDSQEFYCAFLKAYAELLGVCSSLESKSFNE